jgi:predicted dehydrogenase
MLEADFGFRVPVMPHSRLFDPELGGGALLDLGIYPLALASMLFGPPARITSSAHLGRTGVDEAAAVLLGYAGPQQALLLAALRTRTPQTAVLRGTQGSITLLRPWWRAERLALAVNGRGVQIYDEPLAGNGYNYEAAEVGRCLRAGQLESAVMPLDETLSLMQTMDQIRAQWGLRYPVEVREGDG